MNNPITLQDASERFTGFLKNQKRASATILAYTNDIAQLTKFLSGKGMTVITTVTQELLDEFKSDLGKKGYTAKSISRKINSIKTFFRFLKTEGVIEVDPAASVAHPKYEVKPPRILSKLEYRALRDACRGDARISAIVELMLQTGIRIGEVANLNLEDYKDNEIYIKPFESHEARAIPLNKAAKEALEKYLKERPNVKEKAIFVTKTGRPFLIRNIRSSIERYFDLAGIKDAKVNDLRHTWVFHHLAAGTPLVTISKLAGHKRLSTTEKYLKLIGDKKEGAVKLEEL
ncbi:MAG: tyrosine-type recombinase/integrase [Patescibacteria group bacterium]|nr:tyrosine-type recombinase/integrase [Patescibacteria group bacterium]